MIGFSNFAVRAQSTDKNFPTAITSRTMSDRRAGQKTFYYSLRARRGSVVTVRANISFTNGGNFSLDFRGMAGRDGGAKRCCEGDSYLFLDHGSRVTQEIEKSFTVVSNDPFYMILNYNSPNVRYAITFDGIELGGVEDEDVSFDDDDESDDETIIVPGRSGNNWIDTGIRVRRGDTVILDPSGSVDVSAGWGVHNARGTRRYAPGANYPVNSRTRYGLAAKIVPSGGSIAQKWGYGDSRRTLITRSGTLWLTVNDDAPDDNSGEFEVRVTVRRK